MNDSNYNNYIEKYKLLEEKLFNTSLPYKDTIEISKEIASIKPIVEKIEIINSNNAKIEELEKIEDNELANLVKEEISTLTDSNTKVSKELYAILNGDVDEEQEAIIEIRPGTGGEEAELFSQDLIRMYKRYAQRKGFKLEDMDKGIFSIKGMNVIQSLQYESGVHRVKDSCY